MKKMLITMMIFCMTLTMAACSSGQPQNVTDVSGTSSGDFSSGTETVKTVSYIGQVSDKVGNDITVSLGELILGNGSGSGAIYYIGENGNERRADMDEFKEIFGEVALVPIPGDDSGDGTDENTSDSSVGQIPINYMGEVCDFTIPAGAKITNSLGKEISFDNVTKGSLIQLMVNEETGVVESLMVM